MPMKAEHYLEQLEAARCEGNWDAVPELVRKVRKHAPQRSCLTLAAETECAISRATAAASRPSAAATARDLDVSARFPKLLAAIDHELRTSEDRFQAQVCVGWLHWVVGEYSLTLERLPRNMDDQGADLSPEELTCEWTHVCALKSAYLTANCLMRRGQRTEALAALKSAVPTLSRVWSGHGIRKQLRYWSELFLTEYCVLLSEAIDDGDVPLEDPSTLAPFRSWARYWEVMQAPFTGGHGFKGSVPRRHIWKEYYMALSRRLENNLSYETGLVETIPNHLSARSQLRAELKHVETAYRTLLLSETPFPRANEEREEIETFIQQAIKNWSILCGRGWREEDLGEGGRGAIGRGMLEILYSAATRTYHSTAILRSLFSVHLSLAEFDLAFKALDSYLEIVRKAKARVDKTGKAEPSLDKDDMVLETLAQGIVALCRYGHRQAGERARQLGAELEDWLSRLPQIRTHEKATPSMAEDTTKSEAHPSVAPHIIALAWQAIGISHAHWSRLTHEAGSRTEIQSKAIRCLRMSLAAELGRSKDVRALFTLAVLLAEQRELAAAIELTKSALISTKGQKDGYSLLHGPYWQERMLIPLWHLLALLLSARQDYAMASRACEGALEQFKDPATLYGKTDAGFRSNNLDETGASAAAEAPWDLVDDMDDSEREGILEIKMTQLALTELTEGPDAAVNASYELLIMFTRFFGSITAQPVVAAPASARPPSMSGTFRSLRGSIFGHKPEATVPPPRQPSASMISEKSGVMVSRPATSPSSTTAKPTIQVTEENGCYTGPSESRRASSSRRRRSESRTRNSLKKRDRSRSSHRPGTSGRLSRQAAAVDGDGSSMPTMEPEPEAEAFSLSSKRSHIRMTSFSKAKAISLGSHISTTSKSTDYSELTADLTHPSPHVLPLVEFSKERATAQRSTILIKIWLTIAGFYRRANMVEDCKGAIAEAQKLVQSLETELAQDQAVAGSRAAGWAERRSIDDLWGDVWSELGHLSLAQGDGHTARSDFEHALTHSPDHAAATVSLCNILLDLYSEKLRPAPVVPPLEKAGFPSVLCSQAEATTPDDDLPGALPSRPLGLGPPAVVEGAAAAAAADQARSLSADDHLPAPYKATRLPLADRLAARDRALTLLSGLTRLGSGWDDSDAWFALARAYEESGQVDKAKEVLWWCVELEEAMAVRDWRCLGGGGYVI